jgi:hypothetical protein
LNKNCTFIETSLLIRGEALKGRIYRIVSILGIVVAILWWQVFKQDKDFMDSLLLHQPIEINQDDAIHIWEKGTDMKKVPPSNAQIVVNTETGATITINYVDGKIYVSRTDVKTGGIGYVCLDDSPKLESFFEELINASLPEKLELGFLLSRYPGQSLDPSFITSPHTRFVGSPLRTGNTKSCGCLRIERLRQAIIIDLTGKKFGKLTVLFSRIFPIHLYFNNRINKSAIGLNITAIQSKGLGIFTSKPNAILNPIPIRSNSEKTHSSLFCLFFQSGGTSMIKMTKISTPAITHISNYSFDDRGQVPCPLYVS